MRAAPAAIMHSALRAAMAAGGKAGIAIGIGACLAAGAAQAAEAPLILHYSASPPLHYADTQGKLTGFAAKPAMDALNAAGIPFQIRQTPAKQQIVQLQENKEAACMLSWLQTPERERIGNFTEVVYEDKRPFALTWAGNPAMHNEEPLKDTLTDKRLRLLVRDGTAYGVQIDRALLRYKVVANRSNADAVQMLGMLARHQADYFFITDEEAAEAIKNSGYAASSFQRIYFSDLYKGHERRMWCSKAVPDDVMRRLNAALLRQHKP